jgi:hypothetical protein
MFKRTDRDRMTIERVNGLQYEYTNSQVFGDKVLKGIAYWEVKFLQITVNARSRTYVGVTTNRSICYYTSDICVSLAGAKNNCNGTTGISGYQGDSIGILVNTRQQMLYVFHNEKYANLYAKLNPSLSYYPVIHLIEKNVKIRVVFPRVIPKTPTKL